MDILQRLSFILILAFAALHLSGCGGTTEVDDDRLVVVATTGQIHDALRNVAGDEVVLHGLLGPGIDPHLYVPTESNVQLFNSADIIVYNGLHLEAQMTRILDQLGTRGVVVVAIGDAIPAEQLLSAPGGAVDPHIWNDPSLWKLGVEAMRDALIAADPSHADIYRANTTAYLAEIDAAQAFVAAQIERIPADQRILITAHDAFGYFAQAFGLQVYGIQGISTEAEASTADVQNLAEIIVTNRVPAIFVETSVSPRTIEALQAAVADRGYDVAIGGQLFSDALGESGHPAATYTGMLRYNAQTLADALADG